MANGHNPPADFQFNKLRTAGGSHRLTLVKAAVEQAKIDVGPPRPTIAHIPVGDGVWVGFDVDRYPSQLNRVRIRSQITNSFSPESTVVGEFPVPLQGKLGSAVTLVPKQLVESLESDTDVRVTTVALTPGLLLFATEQRITDGSIDIESVLHAGFEPVD